MGLIDKELQQKHATEERLMHFARFVKAQKAKGSGGMGQACLLSEGYRDYYGEVVFARGMHRNLWILPAGENKKVLIFTNRAEARGYAKKLEGILRANGYPFSKARPEPVALQISTPHPYSGLRAPTVTYEAENRYIIRLCIR